ncbi:hypothetical protein GCM10028808_16290 [Spirosoma migulaei]
MGKCLRLLLSLFLLIHFPVFGQQSNPPVVGCAVSELTPTERKSLEQEAAFALRMKMATNAAFTAITYVPIRPHILRRSDGTGGMSLASMNQVMAITNSYFLLNGYGIQFYFCGTSPDYVDNDAQYTSFSDETLVTQGHDVPNALNQYYVNSFASGAGGYAYYPGNNPITTRSFILNEVGFEDDMGNRLIPHELGHNFNLVHTFGERSGNGTLGSGTSLELVTRGAGANCTTEGDYICDTPADPYNMAGAYLTYVNSCPQYDTRSIARDANNQPYSPSISNIMSYYFPCTSDFTPGQYDRMQAGLALRQSHTAYTLNYPPTAVIAPSNVVVSMGNNQVILNWKDNGTNEMGYFIERSTAPSSGFVMIGGVGPNSTTFTDTKIASLTTYYYRIKPSNSTTSGISPTVSITTPTCHPSYLYPCLYPVGLASVAVNGVLLSQNSGCSPNGYGVFLPSATVYAGLSHPVSATLLYAQYTQGVTIWADLNRNGSYDTNLGERIFQTPTIVTGQFSGTLTFPASLTAGALPIRVVTIYNGIPNEPCGAYTFGETEDYVLTIINSADLSLSLKTSARTAVVNQPITYSLTMHNDGPLTATGIQWQNRLPAGLTYVSSGTDIIGSSTAVSGTSSISLATGQDIIFTYQLRATQPGVYVNAAQIIRSDQADPDSQPDSGTGDGQDDTASVDIRTNPDSSVVYISPNPNQTPLPPVLPNQPSPNPTKADLSLRMAISNHTARVGKPVTFSIIVSNAGGLSASTITIRDTLRGLTFSSSPTGMSVVSSGNGFSVIEGKVNSLTAGGSAQLVFIGLPLSIGYVKNAAQIWSAGTLDPDSTPGSVTPTANNLNGEDDVAWVDMRVDS